MAEMAVSFLYFDGCPLAPKARANLACAIDQLHPDIRVGLVEVDLMDPHTPDSLRYWGSPTILIDDQDITGAEQGSACSCRIYASEGGVPSADEITQAICDVAGCENTNPG